VLLPAGRTPRLLLLIALCALVECGAAPGSALGQYQPTPQYQPAPRYQPAPQYQPVPQYQPPVQIPPAPVYQPGPYDDYNPYLAPGYQGLKSRYGDLQSRHRPVSAKA
jgi:hypothetical protein